ncbi:MAG: apolipoprotein N-acyltransferase, partial [Paracoccaceae bacterium]|nr:apolipoprotein N-acyltransferase [Paracoccaceae bacterium]
MRNWQRFGLAFGLGVAVAAGQAPLDLWWLALPALAAVIHLVARAGVPRQAAVLALFAGAGHFAAALSWIVEPFLIDVARHGWMAPFAVVLLSFGLALFWALAAYVARGRDAA